MGGVLLSPDKAAGDMCAKSRMLIQLLSPAKKMIVNIAVGRRGWLGRSLRLSGQIGHWPLQSLVVSKPQNMPFPSLPDTQLCVSHQHTAMVENKNT